MPEDPRCHGERHLDLDGPALTWGLSYHLNSSAECCAACVAFEDPDPRNWTCNSWVFCPEEECWSPDIWNHTRGECWLKMQEDAASPVVNFRGDYPAAFRQEHKTAPEAVQCAAHTHRNRTVDQHSSRDDKFLTLSGPLRAGPSMFGLAATKSCAARRAR